MEVPGFPINPMATTTEPLVWFITGTSSGFGRCLVHAVLARGDFVVATARSTDSIADLGPPDRFKSLSLDVNSGPEAIRSVVEKAVSIWGRIDTLVNNAGYVERALFEEAGSALFRNQ
ncbi:hypothetical protein HGRIS_010544 [Hohenbuehelia grisea]|uniref:NAD(P)-binding protein n=1 Tax=Hohenbuehelia grisea TaxID=104357 RepID=A0ABR3IXG3_9AGAR